MTVPTGEYATDNYEEIDEDTAYNPVLVEVAGTVQRQNAPDFGGASLFTAPLAGTGVPVQILNRRPTREQAYVRNNDPANSIIIAERLDKLQQVTPIGFIIPPGGVQKIESQQPYYAVANNVNGTASLSTLLAGGNVTSPGAGANISGFIGAGSLPAGMYTVTATVYIDGTVAAGTDDDNMRFNISGTHIPVGVTGVPTTITLIESLNGATALNIQSITAGTAGAVYHAIVTATPLNPSAGFTAAPVSVSVLDEAWLVLDNAHRERGYRGKD